MEAIAALVIAAEAFILLLLCRRMPSQRGLPYSRRASLLTPCEMRFYRALLRAVPCRRACWSSPRCG